MLRYTSRMQLRINTYIDGDSFVHTCDVKVLLLCAYTATVFWVETWAGQFLLVLLCLVLTLSARVPLGRMLAMGIPVYMMAALTVLFASINGQVGFALGCFYGVRMILLVLGSSPPRRRRLPMRCGRSCPRCGPCMYPQMTSPWCSAWLSASFL